MATATAAGTLLRLATAGSVDDVVVEVAASRLTERGATRADDRISEAAMEDRKKEGYF
jgi:sulfate adenylyltransferase subunit 2